MDQAIQQFKNYVLNIVPMDDATFDLCVPYLEVSKLRKNDFFIRSGQICRHLAFIEKGLFRIFHLKDGHEITTCFCLEDTITTDFESFANSAEAENFIQALEDSVVVKLSKESLDKLYKESSNWQTAGISIIGKECARLSSRVNSLSFETALEKYRSILKDQPELIQRVSVQHIASYIGVSRETLSRIRKQVSEE